MSRSGRNDDCRSQLSSRPPPPRKVKKQSPQKTVDDFWDKFTTQFPGKVHTILPQNGYAKAKAARQPKGPAHDQGALKSYEEAKAECQIAVYQIAKECRRVNMRYRDPHFDIEFDLKQNNGPKECLEGLAPMDGESFLPSSVKRVPEIFDNPQFYVDDATASDVRQGLDGDCWFLSALCALGNKEGLISRICVARDEKVGVYGFVFHRDGEWIQTIIDDKLYLSIADYDESRDEKWNWDKVFNRQDAEEEYRKAYQTNSRALYFAQCSTENETWLPLVEKAFAKAHGDYRAIDGGFTGEAIEDLTGGVTTEIFTTDILDKDQFWTDELMKVNVDFLFGCATGCFDNWMDGGRRTGRKADRKGVVAMHAYSIMEAREIKEYPDGRLVVNKKGKPQPLRLCKIRNPWGKTEWQGAWSDGSGEWNADWMKILNHKFGNDGIFWISYEDLLRRYQSFDRTRLFGPEWTVTQQWTTVDVPWTADYNDTKFTITVSKDGPIVIVLSQLDDRYYKGFEGEYRFSLHFRLQKDGEHDYIVRSHGNYMMNRSVSTDLDDLEAGTYSVLMKITAKRYSFLPTPDDTIRENCKFRQEKLLRIGLAYDLAHARGQIRETKDKEKARLQRDLKKEEVKKKKQREELRAKWYKNWLISKKAQDRTRRHRQKEEEHRRKKAEGRKAANDPEKPIEVDTPSIEVPATNGEVSHDLGNDESAIEKSGEQLKDDATLPKTNERNTEQPDLPSPPADNTPTTENETNEMIPSGQDETTQDKIDQFNQARQSKPPSDAGGLSHPRSNVGVDDNFDNFDSPAQIDQGYSETSSILSFDSSIDSDLDREELENIGRENVPSDGLMPPPPPPPINHSDNGDDDLDFANNPWNAVCVVGLRVFSKDGGISVGVSRPKNPDEVDEDGDCGEEPLDLDDPSKRMSEHKESMADVEAGMNRVDI